MAKRSTFKKGSGCFTCRSCKKQTRDVDGNGSLDLCQLCMVKSENGNSLSDAGFSGDAWGMFEDCQNVQECHALLTLEIAKINGTEQVEREAAAELVINLWTQYHKRREPKVIPNKKFRHKTIGAVYGINGVPNDVRHADLEVIEHGFVFQNEVSPGTYAPKFFATQGEAFAFLKAGFDTEHKDFTAQLATMDNKRLASQVGYWTNQ